MIQRTLISLLAAAVLVIFGTGCKNTAHGAGKDIEKAGEKIQEKTR
jgi:predicted small secreted protein